MKVYVITEVSVGDGMSGTPIVKVFAKKETALDYYKQAVEQDKAMCEDIGWVYDDDFKGNYDVEKLTSYSSWEDGEWALSHYTIDLCECEVE